MRAPNSSVHISNIFLDTPTSYEVISTGGTALKYPNLLGAYYLNQYDGRAVYNHSSERLSLDFNSTEQGVIHDSLDTNSLFAMANGTEGQFYTDSKWEKDLTLRAVRGGKV